jgi:ElaB/YqjD/DUF883 family membrane-anchored ribosome-binding protein
MNRAEIARERLFSNLKNLMGDVEELLKATAESADDSTSNLRDRLGATLESARGTLGNGKKILETSKQGAEVAMSYAHENPWTTAGIATGAAVALGCVLWSRCAK